MGKIRNIKLPNNETYDIYGKNVENIDWSDYEALPTSKTSNDVAYFIDNVPAEDMADENIGTFSGALATFDNAMPLPMPSLKVSVEAKQEGSGTPSPENVRPISGWSEVKVSDVGKNLLNIADCSYENGTVTVKDGLVKINGTFKNKNLTISSDVNIAELNDLYGKELTFSKTDVKGNMEANPIFFTASGSWNYWHMSNDTNKGTITLDRTLMDLVFYLDGTFDVEFYLQIELGSEATTYEPYNGTTTTISLGQTVYGAEVDAVNGGSTEGYGFEEFNSSDGFFQSNAYPNVFNKLLINKIAPISNNAQSTTCICNQALVWEATGGDAIANRHYISIQRNNSNADGYISIRIDGTTLNDLNDYLQANPVQFKYPLATPTTFTTSPTPIKSLEGTNNLFVDCGEVIEGRYYKQSSKQIRLNDSVYSRSPEAIHAIYADIAEKATKDESGNNIKDTYANSFSISDHTITLKNKNGTSLGTVTVPDNNTTYTLSANTTNNKITLTPSSGTAQSITVPYATKATQDESGNNIKANYASSISISDHTITLKNKNNISLGTVTVPNDFVTPVEKVTTPTSLATFEASEMPMPSLKVSVEAKQDLHGYDHPWVGGAGKNKLPMTVSGIKVANTSGTWSGNAYTLNGVTFTIQTDVDENVVGIATSGTSSNYIYFTLAYVDAEIGMIINGAPTGGDRYKWFQAIDTTSDFDYGNGATISTSVTNKKFMIVVANGVDMSNKTFHPMIRLATETDPTFAPYSNICPISGWSEVNVSDVGKNLLKVTATTTTVNGVTFTVNDDGSIDCSGTATGLATLNVAYGIPISPKYGKVILSGLANARNIIWNYVAGFDDNDVELFMDSIATTANKTFNLAEYPSLTKLAVSIKRYQNAAVSGTVYPQLEIGETATDFEPYQGNFYTISLPQTVYGGEVDVVNGGGTEDYGFIVLNGSNTENWTTDVPSSGKRRFSCDTLPSLGYTAVARIPAISNCYKNTTSSSYDTMSEVFILRYINGSNRIDIMTEVFQTVEELTAFLSQTPLQIRYELATPTTFTTQPTLFKSLEGTNNLSVDCGEVIEGEYMRPEYNKITAKIAEKAGTVLQKQLHHTGSTVEEHKILFSSKETTSTDQNKGDAYDCVSKDDGFSYYTSDNEHGLVLTTLGKNMVEGDYLTFASLTNKELRMFSRPNLSSGTQPDIMTVKPDDIVIAKDGWDGNVANSSLKTTLAKARKGVSDYTLTSYGSSTNCDWSDSFVHKNNGVVYLNAFVEVTSNLSAGDTIFTFNNNTPICPYNIGDAGFPVIVEDENDNLTLNYISCLDNNNFEIKKPVSAGNYINVSFVYLNNKGE